MKGEKEGYVMVSNKSEWQEAIRTITNELEQAGEFFDEVVGVLSYHVRESGTNFLFLEELAELSIIDKRTNTEVALKVGNLSGISDIRAWVNINIKNPIRLYPNVGIDTGSLIGEYAKKLLVEIAYHIVESKKEDAEAAQPFLEAIQNLMEAEK